MYAIIYWENDDTVKPILNEDGTLLLCEFLKEADTLAENFQNRFKQLKYECRVISIEGVKE